MYVRNGQERLEQNDSGALPWFAKALTSSRLYGPEAAPPASDRQHLGMVPPTAPLHSFPSRRALCLLTRKGPRPPGVAGYHRKLDLGTDQPVTPQLGMGAAVPELSALMEHGWRPRQETVRRGCGTREQAL